jgi:hypothetical protein
VRFGVDRREASLILVFNQGRLSPFNVFWFCSDKAARLIAGPLKSLAIVPAYRVIRLQIISSNLVLYSCLRRFVSQPGGDEGTRTPDIRLAKAALSQLSYIPVSNFWGVGLTGFEPVTPALSAQCSNQLSYRPGFCLTLATEKW